MVPGGIITATSPTLMEDIMLENMAIMMATTQQHNYVDGIVWYGVTGYWHSLKSVTMAIRPSNYITERKLICSNQTGLDHIIIAIT